MLRCRPHLQDHLMYQRRRAIRRNRLRRFRQLRQYLTHQQHQLLRLNHQFRQILPLHLIRPRPVVQKRHLFRQDHQMWQ